jgi:carbon storage regulator
MLILSRKVGQAIHIGDDVVIYIDGFNKDEITIGIKAPGHIAIYEAEAPDETPPLPEVEYLPEL